MAKVIKQERPTFEEVSRRTCITTRHIYDDGTNIINDLESVVCAGALQRIAKSMERLVQVGEFMENSLRSIDSKQGPSIYHLQKQVGKLSMRLKKAGLDYNPNSDNRGRKKTT